MNIVNNSIFYPPKSAVIRLVLIFFIINFGLIIPGQAHAATDIATLVNTIDTSAWSPPSPDPAGITYNPSTNTLFVADSEVDEVTIFQGKNVYETTLTGTLVSTAHTMAFTAEPTDIAFNPTNGHYFFSNDGMKRVYEADLGADGTLGTSDDIVTFISALAFGSSDTEGVGYGNGKLFVADGIGQTIYVVDPGSNGRFDGVAPTGDDQVTSFNVGVFGIADSEGVAYNSDSGTLFVVDYKGTNKIVVEVTTDGQLVRKIDISQAGALHPGGITYAPASNNPSQKHLYIVDRAVDNNSDPNENDGKIYEMALPSSVPTTTPTPLPSPCIPGDVSCDDIVNLTDLSTLLSNFGTNGGRNKGDLDGNGLVNLSDLSILLANFGKTGGTPTPTPTRTPTLTPTPQGPTPTAPAGSFSFTTGGDHGLSTHFTDTITTVKNSGSAFYLTLGDLSYSPGSEQNWCTMFKSQFNNVVIVAGNHDVGENNGGDVNNYRIHCPFTLGTVTGDYGKRFYFDYPQSAPLARIIGISPGLLGSMNPADYLPGGSGYVFTQQAIDSARSQGIRWIFIAMHKDCITIGVKGCGIGRDMFQLMIDKKVDVILGGHDHNYQRSHMMNCFTQGQFNPSCIVDNGTDGIYQKGLGSVTMIVGTAGRDFYGVNQSDSEAGYFAKAYSDTWGVSKFTVTASQVTMQFLRSGGGSSTDSFTITQ